jgi:serine/threonine-protein kinase
LSAFSNPEMAMEISAIWRRRLVVAAQGGLLMLAAGGVFLVSAYLTMRQQVFGTEVEVPAVLATEIGPAREGLEARDLVLEATGSRHDPRVPAGQILSQDPPAGARLKPGRKVKVLISLGPEDLRVPQVVGMPVARARVLLGQAKLQVGTVAYVHSRGNEENLVVSQDPPAEAAAERGGTIDLLVSRGVRSARRVMPDLVGMTVADARRLLERNGFALGSVRPEPGADASSGKVSRQTPLAGRPVTRADAIVVQVAAPGDVSGAPR